MNVPRKVASRSLEQGTSLQIAAIHGLIRPLKITGHAESLDLLGSPRRVRLAHVRRGLDRGDVLQHDITNADKSDNGTGNISQNAVM